MLINGWGLSRIAHKSLEPYKIISCVTSTILYFNLDNKGIIIKSVCGCSVDMFVFVFDLQVD